MVEFGLIIPMFAGTIFLLIITGLWLYNSVQTSQAARIAAHHLAVTGRHDEAVQRARDFLSKRNVAAKTIDVVAYWSGDSARARAETEMETFVPALPKLFNPSAPIWTDKVTISKEALTTSEYRFRPGNSKFFN